LWIAVLRDVKAFLAEAGNRLSSSVDDNHVHHNDAAFGSDGGALSQRGNYRLLVLRTGETDPREKKE
jgi:hypothetical protein